ncbi:hypothetical protein H6S27_04590 [Escherichia coli]|nr:hypothetical protein H6S27_04590 [Escherichia coli]
MGVTSVRYQAQSGLESEGIMAGVDFLLPMAAGATLSWASYSVVAHVVSKEHISTLRAIAWGALGTLSVVLGVCAFSAVGAEQLPTKHNALCSGNSPECYAMKWHTEFGHLNRGDMLTSEQHRCSNEKKKFQRRV